MSLERINALSLPKDEVTFLTLQKRVYIPKKNTENSRPLGIPTIEDKLVQEVAKDDFGSYL